jgi:hypothetical protein
MTNGPKLNPDETVVLRCEGVGYGNTMFGKNHELILTNQAILLQKMGLFGKPKDVLRFPLADIRVVNGQVQVMMGKKDFVTPSLDVYFESGMESFLITWEKDIRQWIKTITALVRGEPLPQQNEFEDLEEDMAKMAAFAENLSGSLSDSIFKVRDALGMKSHEQMAEQCPSCGASLTGLRGEVTQCPYCGSYIKL